MKFENSLKYRPSSYFNTTDYFVLYNDGLKKYNVTKLQFHQGSFYSLEGLEYKMTSVPCVNCNELLGMKVTYKDTPIKGILPTSIDKILPNTFGINWESGKNIRKYGLPYYWNNPKNLELI